MMIELDKPYRTVHKWAKSLHKNYQSWGVQGQKMQKWAKNRSTYLRENIFPEVNFYPISNIYFFKSSQEYFDNWLIMIRAKYT